MAMGKAKRTSGTRKAKLPAKAKPKPAADTVFQFKITLLGATPPIWRRIQVRDCTLDKLHEHIQTSMGWTNSHLHHFRIGEQLYGDPMLMEETMAEMNYRDSTTTTLGHILPQSGKFPFIYEYDFGDSWEHEVVFEGCPKPDAATQYPICLEGKRACPPEDCGGVWGYADFLRTIGDKKHKSKRVEMLEWAQGWFDPEEFDATTATKSMKKGLPDWRRMS
jgi:hypothetical protein